jgi:hypothetical protein
MQRIKRNEYGIIWSGRVCRKWYVSFGKELIMGIKLCDFSPKVTTFGHKVIHRSRATISNYLGGRGGFQQFDILMRNEGEDTFSYVIS